MKYKFLTKYFLIDQYENNKKSFGKIAEEFNCTYWAVNYYVHKYGIKIRSQSEAIRGKLNGRFTDGKYCSGIYFCIDCGKELSYKTKTGRCSKCVKKMVEIREKLSKAKRGIPRTEETKEKIRNSYYHTHHKKELHWNWQGGISFEPYSYYFNEELKEKIRKRDNYQCQGEGCPMTQEEHLIIYDRSLTIHHIDYNKKNCKESNLINLCLQCNSRVNFNRNYWINYFKNKLKSEVINDRIA